MLEWLYHVETPVSSRTSADRQAAARRALDTMLTRLTGLAEVPRSPAVNAALNAPERYYQRYSFVADADETRLAVSFAPAALRELVAEARLPIWAADRPVALAWVVVAGATPQPAAIPQVSTQDRPPGIAIPLGAPQPEAAASVVPETPGALPATPATPSQMGGAADGTNAHAVGEVVLSSTSRHPLATALRQRARQRGIEIRLPLMDLEDRDRIRPATLLNGYAYTIREASVRYRSDYIILGRARRMAEGVWVTDWRLWLDGAERPLVIETPDAATSAIRAVDAAGDELARRFAVTGAESSYVALEVRGANSVAGYAGVLKHLAGLAFLDHVELVEANADAITLRVATRSSRARLGELLVASDAFDRVSSIPAPNPADAPMRLWWTVPAAVRTSGPRHPPKFGPSEDLAPVSPVAAHPTREHRR